jgi:hypothetical protein
MKPLLIGFGVMMVATSLATGRTVPFARGWTPGEQPSRAMRWVGLLGVATGIWIVVASRLGIFPLPRFSRF